MTVKAQALDKWIRNEFRAINSELEELYFNLPDLRAAALALCQYQCWLDDLGG